MTNKTFLKAPSGSLISIKEVDSVYYNAERKSVLGKAGGIRGQLMFAFDVENAKSGAICVETLSEIIIGGSVPDDFDWEEIFKIASEEENINKNKGLDTSNSNKPKSPQ